MTEHTSSSSELPRILLIGANGQVGEELQRTLAPLGEVVAASLEGEYGPRIDLTQPGALADLITRARPAAIVNAAAYTAVDRAETDVELAHRVNAGAVAELGEQAARSGIPVVHYSTDFVFSGTLDRPYTEDDPTEPLNVYGSTKLAGEHALLDSGAPALIFRTSWVYSARGANFLRTMLKLFQERDELRVVNDQVGCPTWARMLAEITGQVLYRVLRGELDLEKVGGLYHLSGGGQVSWYGFANAILEESGLESDLIPIPTSEYPAPARRPAYSVLDNSRFQQTFGLAMPQWRYSLAQCIEDLRSKGCILPE